MNIMGDRTRTKDEDITTERTFTASELNIKRDCLVLAIDAHNKGINPTTRSVLETAKEFEEYLTS